MVHLNRSRFVDVKRQRRIEWAKVRAIQFPACTLEQTFAGLTRRLQNTMPFALTATASVPIKR
jgi:hypothetical protein